jgi:hypothetical protein
MSGDNRTIEQFHADRESGTGCPETDGGPHYFAFLGPFDYRSCIDCGDREPIRSSSTGDESMTADRNLRARELGYEDAAHMDADDTSSDPTHGGTR